VGRRLGAALAATALVGGLLGIAASTAGAQSASPAGFRVDSEAGGVSDINVCSTAVPAGVAHCLAHRRIDRAALDARPARPGAATAPTTVIGNNGAYDPAYLDSAYNVPTSRGTGQTVAIVDAMDDPNAASDLAAYRTQFNLPACGAGCFTKVNQTGGTSLPSPDAGWSEEISLDLDMVSAICPNCKILLVEASSASITDLGTAVNTAVAMGANAVSNSYGSSEFSGEVAVANTYYNHPGVAITASSGDSGYGVEFPAAASTVTAVGGTSLRQLTNTGTRNGQERAWKGAGSGCSAYVAKPTAWQKDTGCANRTVADVSAVADPATGVWVYDTYQTGGTFGIFGGTSASSPIIASMYALAQNPVSTDTLSEYPYETKSGLNDVTAGTNGTCAPTYLCTGVVGYDGPTGLGTPKALTAFSPGVVVTGNVPNAPVLTAATSLTKGVSLSWPAPANNGSAITSYELYRGLTSGSEKAYKAIVCSAASCTFADTGVPTGKTAFYKLTAINAVGASPMSNEVSAAGK
jgi:hypothetical protein